MFDYLSSDSKSDHYFNECSQCGTKKDLTCNEYGEPVCTDCLFEQQCAANYDDSEF